MKRSLLFLFYCFAAIASCSFMAAGCGDSVFYVTGEDADAENDSAADPFIDDGDDTAADPDAVVEPDAASDPDTATDPDVVADPDAMADPDLPADPEPEEEPGVCSGHGTPYTWPSGTFCACDPGYSPSSSAGNDCVPTGTVCKGGTLSSPIDVDGDGVDDTHFDPSPLECEMYELVNYTRATHDPEGSPECHTPLMYNLKWSAHGRNHCFQMSERGGLFHDDYPMGQNCAVGCGPSCEMDLYMNGAGEDHCPALSHHCNIMRCSFSQIGVGYWTPESGTWNTQNFL